MERGIHRLSIDGLGLYGVRGIRKCRGKRLDGFVGEQLGIDGID
jgi:hypothetical protein